MSPVFLEKDDLIFKMMNERKGSEAELEESSAPAASEGNRDQRAKKISKPWKTS